jgi:DNA-binding winged helix-turn-helix (wHTH) protein/Flp pilus assembly protein TadD
MIGPKDSSSSPISDARKLRFGVFEVDLRERELRKRGIRLHLQKKPFQVLELLLRKAGTLVTRAELEKHLWPDLHVNFGHGLNTAINSLREALGDSSSTARFIETRPGLGYRFTASVEEVAESPPTQPVRLRYKPKPEAEQCYQKGKYLQNKLTETDLGKSIPHFEAAIAQDRRYALAYIGLAETNTLFAILGLLPPSQAQRRAEDFTSAALDLDADLSEAHASAAAIRMFFDRDYATAEREYLRALQLDPANADGHRQYATFLAAMGRFAEASVELQAARELNALSISTNLESARIHYFQRQFQACIDECWQMLILEAEFAPAQHILGLAYEQMAMYDDAITELRNAYTCSRGNPCVIAALGHAHVKAGSEKDAKAMLEELVALSRQRYVSPYWRSIVHLGFEEFDTALDLLATACTKREVSLLWLKVEPRFDPIRSDPRFQNLLSCLGLRKTGAYNSVSMANAGQPSN